MKRKIKLFPEGELPRTLKQKVVCLLPAVFFFLTKTVCLFIPLFYLFFFKQERLFGLLTHS